MIRRRAFAFFAPFAFVLGAAAACSFPDVSFRDGSTTDGAPSSDSPSGNDGPAGDDADGSDATIDAVGDAIVRDDASQRVDEASCNDADPCDCDHDTHRRIGCDGGDDCDDLDPLIHPKQAKYVESDWPADSKYPVVGDWDCNGKTEYEFDSGISCSTTSCLATPPTGYALNGVACGEKQTIYTCSGIGCNLTPVAMNQAQGCK